MRSVTENRILTGLTDKIRPHKVCAGILTLSPDSSLYSSPRSIKWIGSVTTDLFWGNTFYSK